MKSRDTGAQDKHRLLREVLTDSVEEAEYDGITGHLSIKTGPGGEGHTRLGLVLKCPFLERTEHLGQLPHQ